MVRKDFCRILYENAPLIKFNFLVIPVTILAIFAFVNLSYADKLHDDPKYLIDLDEVERVLSLIEECCENLTWPNLDPEGRYPNLDYKFPLKDGRSLFSMRGCWCPHFTL